MKKFFLLSLAVVLFSLSANGQKANDRRGLSVGVGVVHNFYLLQSHPEILMDNSCYFGPYVEVGYETDTERTNGAYVALRYEFVHHYTAAGAICAQGSAIGQAYTYRHYFDVPLKYRFLYPFSNYDKFFFDIGPTLNFMFANISYTSQYGTGLGAWTAQKVDWYKFAPDAYNWFNLSFGLNVGLYIDQTKVFIGYDYGGLISYTKDDYGQGQIHQLRIGFSYLF